MSANSEDRYTPVAFDFTGAAYVRDVEAEVGRLGEQENHYAVDELNLKTGHRSIKRLWRMSDEAAPVNALDALLKHLALEGRARKIRSIMRRGDTFLVILNGQRIVYAQATELE